MDVVEETVLGHEEGVGLEGALQAPVRLHPTGLANALPFAELAPVADLGVVGGFHDVGDVTLGVHLLAVLQDLHLKNELTRYINENFI